MIWPCCTTVPPLLLPTIFVASKVKTVPATVAVALLPAWLIGAGGEVSGPERLIEKVPPGEPPDTAVMATPWPAVLKIGGMQFWIETIWPKVGAGLGGTSV